MERDFGVELTRQFGARLRRLYESDDAGLPSPIAACLERLRRAELEKSAGHATDVSRDGAEQNGSSPA